MNSKVTHHQPDAESALLPFDRQSGSLVERLLFNHRGLVVAVCLLLSCLVGEQAAECGSAAAGLR